MAVTKCNMKFTSIDATISALLYKALRNMSHVVV